MCYFNWRGAGLGHAIAKAYAAEGMRLALMDVKGDLVSAVAEELNGAAAIACRSRSTCPMLRTPDARPGGRWITTAPACAST